MKRTKTYIDWLTELADNSEPLTEAKEFERGLREVNQSTYSELGELGTSIKRRATND